MSDDGVEDGRVHILISSRLDELDDEGLPCQQVVGDRSQEFDGTLSLALALGLALALAQRQVTHQ
eukprot:12780725-Heterocapsa_arctica.AAC.1